MVHRTKGSVTRFCSALVLGLLLLACGRTDRRDVGVSGSAGSSSAGGSGAGGGVGVAGELQCPAAAAPEAPLHLLSEHELAADLSDAFGMPVTVDVAPPDARYWAVEPAQIDADFVYGQARLARELASAMSEPTVFANVTGCDIARDGETACRAALSDFVLSRLFRGLADAASVAELDAVFETGVKLGGNFFSGSRAMLEVALQSPEYLYHVELGQPATDRPVGWGKLSDLELASRLSFLLWGTGPDAELLAAARQGSLGTPLELEEQAQRMLGDARARLPVRRFYRQLWGVAGEIALAPQRFPDFTTAVAESLPAAFDRFVDDVTWETGGDFRTLLRSPRSWFNEQLGTYYGVRVAAGAELQPVEQDPDYYSGLLTQAALLATPTYATYPILRGGRLARAFSCFSIPPHPETFGDRESEPNQWGRPFVEEINASTTCSSCHRYVDSLGFGLEHFDASGRFRTQTEAGPVNARGELLGATTSQPFDGAPELAELIVQSPEARACFVQNWQTFAYGTPVEQAETCAKQDLVERFEASQGNIVDLIVGLTQTDSFMYRAIPEDQP